MKIWIDGVLRYMSDGDVLFPAHAYATKVQEEQHQLCAMLETAPLAEAAKYIVDRRDAVRDIALARLAGCIGVDISDVRKGDA